MASYPASAPPYPEPCADQEASRCPTRVVITQPVAVVYEPLTTSPARTFCPNCHTEIITEVSHESGLLTWLICMLLCLIGLQCGCCLVPFCVDACQDIVHTCPHCHVVLGKWHRI